MQSAQDIARQKQFPILVQIINKSMFIHTKYKCVWTRRSPWSVFMSASCDGATRWSPSKEWRIKLWTSLINGRYPGTCPSFIKNSADLMNSEMVLDRYLLDQLLNSATPNNEYYQDWCTYIMFNHLLELYIHIVLKGEDLVAITENDFTFDEEGSTYIFAHNKNIGVLVWKHRQTWWPHHSWCSSWFTRFLSYY